MNPFEIMTMLRNLKTNPAQFLLQQRLNVPQDISNDPNKIIQYLLSTNQVSQEQVNTAYQQMAMFRQ